MRGETLPQGVRVHFRIGVAECMVPRSCGNVRAKGHFFRAGRFVVRVLAWSLEVPVATRWRNADEAGRARLREKHGAKVVEEVQSAEWMLSNCKPCPRCRTNIEKNGGCNHITCRSCRYEWCWLCGQTYKDGHYSSGGPCVQFSQDFFDELNRNGLARAEPQDDRNDWDDFFFGPEDFYW